MRSTGGEMRFHEGGQELDANFSVSQGVRGSTLEVTLEARGGGRNKDYARALELLLSAIAIAGGRIERIEVASQPALQLTEGERTLPLKYPLRLDADVDLGTLRNEVGRLQIPIAQRPGAKGGNSTKRLRIVAHVPGMSAEEFADAAATDDGDLRRRAFLLTWNPDVWDDWDDRDAQIASTSLGNRVAGTWSTGTRKSGIRGGDHLVLLRQGRSLRGIVGLGVADGDPGEECVFRAAHYLQERADEGDEAHYVKVSWQLLLADDERIPIEELKHRFDQVSWDNIQSSGQRLPTDVARQIVLDLAAAESSVGSAPEVKDAKQALGVAAGRIPARQGFRQSAAQRDAIEARAMTVALKHLRSLGWSDITDTSNGNPFDFLCRGRGRGTLHVEVKGTTSLGEAVVLTRREVELHRDTFPANALIVVHSIELDGEKASGGQVTHIQPWAIHDDDLQVIGYTYRTPEASA